MNKIEKLGFISQMDKLFLNYPYQGDIYSKKIVDTLTSELEAERQAKEEAIRLLYKFTELYGHGTGMHDEAEDFIETYTVSKGDE